MSPYSPSLASRALALLRRRPGYVWRALRGYSLFVVSRWVRVVKGTPAGVTLGRNVRLQRNSTVMAESPGARIVIGADSIVYEYGKIESYGRGVIEIGEGSILGDVRIFSRYRIRIGKRFLTSWNVFIQDFDPHPVDPAERRKQVERMVAEFRPIFDKAPPPIEREGAAAEFPGEAIAIGDDVWVGANASILKGARLGDGCIVATGAVVTRGEYPPGSILAGNPARIVKTVPLEAGLEPCKG